MLFLKAERPCHAAATRIDFFHRVGKRDGFLKVARSNQSLFVAVPMDERLCALPLEIQLPAALTLFANDKLLKKEGSFCNGFHGAALEKIGIFVSKGQNAARFAPDDLIALLQVKMELSHIKSRICPGCFRQSLRNHRPPAALSLGKFDVVPRGVQQP